ncbi:hypothetical protein NST44_16005 [Paenibacillus sp. FSL W8-0919]|uniref:hypothetical protein n=1 Tax=Paenibacillus sp. FSL W8-0919 TaxID=2954707 RepID=UPI0030FC7ED0
MKNIKRSARIFFGCVYILAVLSFLVLFGLLLYFAFIDDQIVLNTKIMSRMSLILAAISLPGIVVQLLSLLTINDKKKYIAETKCPNCKHTVDIKLIEE